MVMDLTPEMRQEVLERELHRAHLLRQLASQQIPHLASLEAAEACAWMLSDPHRGDGLSRSDRYALGRAIVVWMRNADHDREDLEIGVSRVLLQVAQEVGRSARTAPDTTESPP